MKGALSAVCVCALVGLLAAGCGGKGKQAPATSPAPSAPPKTVAPSAVAPQVSTTSAATSSAVPGIWRRIAAADANSRSMWRSSRKTRPL
jgi:hypothetical protein